MPCCGRPVFATSPARWETVSMHTSFGNCATAAREPFMSPSMPIATAAASRRRTGWQGRPREEGLNACRVSLPDGHDPNSFFVAGGSVQEFQHLLEGACL